MFVIDGKGIESWYPVDSVLGKNEEFGGSFYGLTFYQLRARYNWSRGCYYMEVWLDEEQIESLKDLLIKKKDWIAGKEYIESQTGRNFETETGYDNPYDPNWEPDFGPENAAKERMWNERAGVIDKDGNPVDFYRADWFHFEIEKHPIE